MALTGTTELTLLGYKFKGDRKGNWTRGGYRVFYSTSGQRFLATYSGCTGSGASAELALTNLLERARKCALALK